MEKTEKGLEWRKEGKRQKKGKGKGKGRGRLAFEVIQGQAKIRATVMTGGSC